MVATGPATGWAFDGYAAAGGEAVWERSGTTRKKVAFPGKSNDYVVTAGATSPTDVWAFTSNIVGAGRALRWNGSKWSLMKSFPFPGTIGAVSVLASNDVWVFGGSAGLGVWHYNGQGWAQVSENYDGGSALAWNDAWAFLGEFVFHWNGHAWAKTSMIGLLPPAQTLNDPQIVGVLALSHSNVYAIGNGDLQLAHRQIGEDRLHRAVRRGRRDRQDQRAGLRRAGFQLAAGSPGAARRSSRTTRRES